MSLVADQLRAHGLSVTAQRVAIMNAITAAPHCTADHITDAAGTSLGTISRQSVYDTLNTLVEKGLVRRIQPMGSPTLYEDRVGDNHHHLICRSCARVVDVDCAVGMRPCLHVADDHEFAIDEAEVVFWGYCTACSTTGLGNRGESAISRSMTTRSNTTNTNTKTQKENTYQ